MRLTNVAAWRLVAVPLTATMTFVLPCFPFGLESQLSDGLLRPRAINTDLVSKARAPSQNSARFFTPNEPILGGCQRFSRDHLSCEDPSSGFASFLPRRKMHPVAECIVGKLAHRWRPAPGCAKTHNGWATARAFQENATSPDAQLWQPQSTTRRTRCAWVSEPRSCPDLPGAVRPVRRETDALHWP